MPALGNLVLWLGTFIASYFGKSITRKAVFGGACVAIIVTAAVTLYTTITAAASALSVAMPSFVMTGASWFVPDNLKGCITAYLTCYVAIALFKFGMKLRIVVANA